MAGSNVHHLKILIANENDMIFASAMPLRCLKNVLAKATMLILNNQQP